jgi:hypothetical protein
MLRHLNTVNPNVVQCNVSRKWLELNEKFR